MIPNQNVVFAITQNVTKNQRITKKAHNTTTRNNACGARIIAD